VEIVLLAENGSGQSPLPLAAQAIFALAIGAYCFFTYRVWHGKRSDPFGNELTDAVDRRLFVASLPASIACVALLVTAELLGYLGDIGGLGHVIVRTIVIAFAVVVVVFTLLMLTIIIWRWPQKLVPPSLRSTARKRG
jgi:hypothetical protein